MTFTPGGFEQSRVLFFGMKYNCSWVIQEMSEYPRMMDILRHKMISTKWILKNAPPQHFSKDVNFKNTTKNVPCLLEYKCGERIL